MKLRHRLIEARRARHGVTTARGRITQSLRPMHQQAHAHPLTCLAMAAGGGLLAGCATGRRGKGLLRVWNDPRMRWLWRFAVSAARA